MSIRAISGIRALSFWDESTGSSHHSKVGAAAGDFSEMFERVSAAMEADTSGESGQEDGQTVTLTKILPDGSLLLTKMEGNRVVSETKLSGSGIQQQQNLLAPVETYRLAYASGTEAPKGSLFSASI